MPRVVRSTIIDAPVERLWAVLRDFNGHESWHPIVAKSTIERGYPSDKIGCVRRFTMQDGAELREQLLALSDLDMTFSYCLLETPIAPGRFTTPAGRETELADLVANDVYSNGIAAVRQLPELAG